MAAVGPPLWWVTSEGIGEPWCGGMGGAPDPASITLRWHDGAGRHVNVDTDARPSPWEGHAARHLSAFVVMGLGETFTLPLTLSHEVIPLSFAGVDYPFDFVTDGGRVWAGLGEIAGRWVRVTSNCIDPHTAALVAYGAPEDPAPASR